MPRTAIQGMVITTRAGMLRGGSIKTPFIVLLSTEPIIMVIEIPDTPPGIIIEDAIIRERITSITIITVIIKDTRPMIRSFSAFRCANLILLQRYPG